MNFNLDQKGDKNYRVPICISLIRKSSSVVSKEICVFELNNIVDHGTYDHDKEEGNDEKGNADNDVDDDYDDHDDDGNEDDDCYADGDDGDCDVAMTMITITMRIHDFLPSLLLVTLLVI